MDFIKQAFGKHFMI